MQLVIEYIKENKKRVLILIVFVILLIVISSLINNDDENKIYGSDEYVYTKESYDHASGFVSELPYINIKSDEINEINIQLINKYYEIITVDEQIMKYKFYKNDNVLSLLVSIYYQYAPDTSNETMFYNVDLESGKLLNNVELMDKFGVTNDEVADIIRDELNKYYNYEIGKGYVSSNCDFICYMESISSLQILDDCSYYVKDNHLYVYKYLLLDSYFYYDSDSGFDLYNFKIN